MGWYRVIKTVKGHRYLYEQRSWREGKHVRTESRYLGPIEPHLTGGSVTGGAARVITTSTSLKGSIPPELEPLAAEARKYKSAEEFVNNYDGGLMLIRRTINNFISGGPENEAMLSKLLTNKGRELIKDMELPDVRVIIEEDDEDITYNARLNWDSDEGLQSAKIYLTISPFEEEGVQALAEKEYIMLHELTHLRQLVLGKADIREVELLERNADKSADFRYKQLKSQLTDFYNEVHSSIIKGKTSDK